jgi:hypothetical protein
MRATHLRRGFGNACLNVAPRKIGLKLSGVIVSRRGHRPHDLQNAGGPKFD